MMMIAKLTRRLQKDRPMTMASLRRPEEVIAGLKRVAPVLGFSGYQALIKASIGQGLRNELERLEAGMELSALIERLSRQGVKEAVIASAISQEQGRYDAACQSPRQCPAWAGGRKTSPTGPLCDVAGTSLAPPLRPLAAEPGR